MNIEKYDVVDLCHKTCREFEKLGYLKDIDPRTSKESYNIIRQPNGQWFKITKTNLHDPPTLKSIEFSDMPNLKIITDIIIEIDSDLHKNGGRIFITENLIYKIKRGTETPLLINQKQESTGRNQKLCNEILEHGLGRDRYRTDETYMLTKAANGEWSMSSSDENHSGVKLVLDLKKMPLLKILANKINKLDPQFQSNGGRIFITPSRIYRLKNKVEIDFKF